MRVRIGGNYCPLSVANLKAYGDMVDPGRAEGRVIRIATWQGEQDTLDTIIHEALHCARPELDEAAVDSTARDISRLLWRMGYRRESGS